jgi:uncharacterized protein (DUF58 family)
LSLEPALVKKIKRIEIISRHLVQDLLTGDYLSAFHGQGLEFSEVREYQPGDEVRSIDWNVTARMQLPYVKVFQEERELTVILMADISGSGEFGTQGSSKRELAADLCAALGFAAAFNGDRVGLILFSDRVEKVLPPKRGRLHALRLVREVLTHKAQSKGSDLKPALSRLPFVSRRHAVVFLLSDFQVPEIKAAMKAPALRYDLVACRLSDPAEETLPAGLGLLSVRDPETGRRAWLDSDSASVRRAWEAQTQERRRFVRQSLRQSHCDFFEVRTGQDFVGPLVGFFKNRVRRASSGR